MLYVLCLSSDSERKGSHTIAPEDILNASSGLVSLMGKLAKMDASSLLLGQLTLLVLTGLFIFMLFFLAATVNAIVISLLMSVGAAGGFLALFFAFMTAIYIGALSVAVFVISTATISAIIAVVITTGWIGFFWTVWLATRKSVSLVKHSLTMTGSALSAYSSARHARRYHETDKISD
ncbi:uncharacterized protein LOC130778049 [Actinidia eriantha]|uniref:uncharacterized protein LOC130778049 n=1 Tax=Actinidia eriantha TaxID=165200 RepID=UPI00258C51A8|nr:uncharacterized protein LOC130778049 [Actinidia eriantha]